MFERFTDRARRVIVLAQDAARQMGHRQITPGHLLLALSEGEGVAANAMTEVGVDPAALRQRVTNGAEGTPAARKMDKVPFSVDAKKSLELSLRAALALGHNYIGTEHLFFGVERQAEQRGGSLDDLLGVRTADVHNRITEMLGGRSAGPPMRSPGLRSALERAHQQAGQAPMTTGHLLAAVVADQDSQAARALGALGVTGDRVHEALAQLPVAGTSDAVPPPQTVAITVGDTTTVVVDADVADALRHLSAEELREAMRNAIRLAKPDEGVG